MAKHQNRNTFLRKCCCCHPLQARVDALVVQKSAMAVHLREVTESPVRSTVYKLDGHHYYYEGQVLREASMPSFPPKEMMFDMMFFRQLFDHMAKSSGGVPVKNGVLMNKWVEKKIQFMS